MQNFNWGKIAKGGFIVSVMLTVNLGMLPSKVLAASVEAKSYFNEGRCKSITATISTDEVAKFDRGEGVSSAGNIYYKSSSLSSCCYEAIRDATDSSNIGTIWDSCRGVFASPKETDPKFSSTGGNLYVRWGTLPNVNLTSGFTSQFVYGSQQDPTGNSAVNSSKFSQNNQKLFNYDSLSVRPPAVSGFGDDWYSYLRRLVEVNLNKTISNMTVATDHVSEHNGDLTISGSCASNQIIFVKGNLTVNPDFNSANTNTCLYIVKNGVTVNNGSAKGGGWDIVNAGIIANGEIKADYDNTGDGLQVNGLLAGKAGKFMRDRGLTPAIAASDPSIRIQYDPRYVENFKQQLKLLKFSTREKGFESSL